MEKKNYMLFINFENYFQLAEDTIGFEIGEFTTSKSTKGNIYKVMAYARFQLTPDEYEAALVKMHEICDLGYSYKEANLLVEAISEDMPNLLRQMRAKRERKQMLKDLREERVLRAQLRLLNELKKAMF